MANANLKISVTSDTSKVQSDLKGLDGQVGKTGEGIGNLGKAAAIGGAALVAVGVKSVLAFEDLGLTVGKFSDATGLSAEASSRLIEVSGDLGISAETVSSAIGKMSKQLGANGDAFKEFNIQAVKGKDGQVDVNETFLHAVDVINGIQDPLKKSEASAKVFGKGYQEMANLLGESSGKIRADLAAVDSQKIFDDKKVKSARDLRDAFDSIKDAGENLLLTIGQALAPVITQLAPTLTKVVQAAMPLATAIGDVLGSALEAIGPIIEALLPVIGLLAKALKVVADVIGAGFDTHGFSQGVLDANEKLKGLEAQAKAAGVSAGEWKQMMADAAGEVKSTGDKTADFQARVEALNGKVAALTGTTDNAQTSTKGYSYAVQDVTKSTADAQTATDEWKRRAQSMTDDFQRGIDADKAAMDRLLGVVNDDEAWLNLQNNFAATAALFDEKGNVIIKKGADAAQTMRDAALAVDGLKKNVIEYGANVLGLPTERITKIVAAVDPQSLADVDALLEILTRNRTMNLSIVAKGGAGYGPIYGGAQADGGPTVPGKFYNVAEAGKPELYTENGKTYLVPSAPGQVTPISDAPSWGGAQGGGGVNVYVTVQGSVMTERDLVRTITDGIIDAQARGEIPTALVSA